MATHTPRHTPIIVGTNVVVAGLITKDSTSPVARILDAAFPFVLSEALLAEYRVMLLRPALRKLHGFAPTEVDTLLTALARHAIVLTPPHSAPDAPEPGDQMLWDLLFMHPDLRLVTGDKLLLQSPAMRGRVLTPRDFSR